MRICSKRAWFHQASANKRWKVSLPQEEQPGLKITMMRVTTILEKVSRKDGMHSFCGVLPSLHWLQEKHKKCCWLFVWFYTFKICVWLNNSRKMACCLCRCQGHGADKQRTPLCYWSGLLHPVRFRVKRPNSTNRICVQLSCLPGFLMAANFLTGCSEEGENSLSSGVSVLVQGF